MEPLAVHEKLETVSGTEMKICIPVTNLTFEGNVVFDLAKELAKQGHEPKIIAPHAKGLKGKKIVDGVEIKYVRYFWPDRLETLAYGSGIAMNISRNPLKAILLPFFFAAFKIRILLEARDCDLIHAHWLPTALACIPAKIFLRKKVLLTVHGTDTRNMPKFLVWLAAKSSDAITTSHESLVKPVERAGGKAEIVRNMIDFDRIERPKGLALTRKQFSFWNKPVVLFIGRFVEVRDPMTFIRAAKKTPEANFVMIGDGKLLGEAKQFAEECKAGNVFFTGRRSDVGSFLKMSRAFVSTATFDNAFSSVVVEAALSGTPMVLTDVGETKKFFNEKNSILFKPGNAGQLADAIKKILADETSAKARAKNARRLVKSVGFDREEILKKNNEIYKKLLDS